MPVSPRDFELYSRMTGAPMPSDAMSRMQMAPEVFEFTKNFARQPNLLERTGNLIKNIGKIGAYGLGMGMQQSLKAEKRLLKEELRNEQAKRDAEIAEVPESPEQVSAGSGVVQTDLNPIGGSNVRRKIILTDPPQYENEVIDSPFSQQPTTADAYGQDDVPNQTASNIINQKVVQGSQIGDETPNVAQVLSESQDSRPSGFADTAQVESQMRSGMEGSELGKDQLAKFLSQKGLDQALLGAIGERISAEPRIGDSSPLLDHPDIVGGEDDINLPGGMNTGSTTNLEDHYREMRRMDAMERTKNVAPSERQVNLLEQRAIDNQEAIDSGFMNLDDAGRKKESIRLGSTGGIPNKTDMAEIRKDPEFIAAQESMKPKSTAERTDDFMAQFVEGAKSDIVRGARGNKSLGITRIPATNGDAQVGFVLANKPLDQSPKFATTYGFGVAPGAESLLDNQLNRDTFSDYMKRGMKEAKQGKQRQAGEIFEYLIPDQRIITGDARLGDIIM
tara:strand:+ start:373 stop:1887 length:1515 start_codon:yes stop_codon:yes gene_type:complete